MLVYMTIIIIMHVTVEWFVVQLVMHPGTSRLTGWEAEKEKFTIGSRTPSVLKKVKSELARTSYKNQI